MKVQLKKYELSVNANYRNSVLAAPVRLIKQAFKFRRQVIPHISPHQKRSVEQSIVSESAPTSASTAILASPAT